MSEMPPRIPLDNVPNIEVIREIIEKLFPELKVEDRANKNEKNQTFLVWLSRKDKKGTSEWVEFSEEIAKDIEEQERLMEFESLIRDAARRLGID